MTPDLYTYAAEVLRVIDGDTFVARIDMGFNCFTNQRVRLLRLDTPERNERRYYEAREELRRLLDIGPVVIRTNRRDSFGRWLAEVWASGINVTDYMLNYLARTPGADV